MDELQDAQPNANDVECQTTFETTPLPSPSPAHFLRRPCVGQRGFNDSLCIHKQERDMANERIENVPLCLFGNDCTPLFEVDTNCYVRAW